MHSSQGLALGKAESSLPHLFRNSEVIAAGVRQLLLSMINGIANGL
jgi:hypothetical protein